MTFDFVLVMPLTLMQILYIALIVTLFLGAATMETFCFPFAGTCLFVLGAAILFVAFIIPGIQSAMPDIPPVWQDALYNSTHPETWFNFTVVWPK